jgi:hypothetical protein
VTAKPVPDPDFEERVRKSFARQSAMTTIGAELTLVTPGIIEIEMPHSIGLTQQHGFLHAGIISTALDSSLRLCRLFVDAGKCRGAHHRVQGQPASDLKTSGKIRPARTLLFLTNSER